ncbi:MAG: DHA2 family efflux MFS transporter permease subunit [Rhodospirillaceae bacterium]|jgi:DHA2 family multidrug resistance protein|nr:DHA2 family efflux MFS transporter permease subunit [Rhodospirillaceae bacterium]MBT4688486.1 DHA2 family efflux MFS transporter permease subunit [Rhodospirillaceae bacterium]MBT5079839.1 DHA2 family efflux MFS transporter permease subunit [Rhodospirillaceae bacterium]MBT5523295.1 DHA2 family efflux MFS transporter permease subunit [Rhodospirillaceae bacterium]MBT5879423.1 DHA2 family efflux MFS transporter permease subunit [Rhodospirillaceae bacterium]
MTAVAQNAEDIPALRRWAILFSITLATTQYAMAILVVSVLLPQMQGSLSATQDEIAWVMIFNILATAVMTPMTGWLAGRFGRRRVMLVSMAGFSLATVACGLSTSLPVLVLFRVAQGTFGAPLIPLGQAIVLDTFPKRQHGIATSVFGMAVVVGPVIGPMLGGILAETYGWPAAFYMFVPFGIIALVGMFMFVTDNGARQHTSLDWTGFLTLSVAVIGLQLLLSRGQRLDWFESPEIIIEAVLAVVALHLFIVHSVTAERPFLNPRLLLDRNFVLGLVIVSIYGMLNFTPMVLLPPMLQGVLGYPDSIIGLLLGMRGAGAIAGFFAAIFISRLDPKFGMTFGFGLQVASGIYMAGFDMNTSIIDVAINSILQGMAVGIIWVPLTVAAFATLDNRYLAEGSAVYHLLRNLGSAVFISLSVTLVIISTADNYAGMTEFVSDYNKVLNLPWVLGLWGVDSVRGLTSLSGEIGRQAAMIGYINAFWAYTMASLAVMPLIFLVRARKT